MRGLSCLLLSASLNHAAFQTPAPRPPSQTHINVGQTHIYVGLWTTHLNADRRHIDSNNPMVAITHGPVFATTFVNSFGKRAYAAGFQHDVLSANRGSAAASLGFRLGAISGYDERFLSFAKDTPVLPMFSVYTRVEERHLGVELSWTMVVLSAALCVRF
jgi:hypothetical protein